MNKKECKMWKQRLIRAIKDEKEGWFTYDKYSRDVGLDNDTRAFFRNAARDERLHYHSLISIKFIRDSKCR